MRRDNYVQRAELFVRHVLLILDIFLHLSVLSVCRVQEAVKTTVLGLLGSLPRQAFETATLTTGDALANLMFQLQMTGYMFKNAEYRMSLQNSLRNGPSEAPKGLITGMLCFVTVSKLLMHSSSC
jgi:Protein of unknown function (DUF760)